MEILCTQIDTGHPSRSRQTFLSPPCPGLAVPRQFLHKTLGRYAQSAQDKKEAGLRAWSPRVCGPWSGGLPEMKDWCPPNLTVAPGPPECVVSTLAVQAQETPRVLSREGRGKGSPDSTAICGVRFLSHLCPHPQQSLIFPNVLLCSLSSMVHMEPRFRCPWGCVTLLGFTYCCVLPPQSLRHLA